MLTIENIDVFYGKVPAIKDLSMEVRQGQLVTVLGANGTGKTTVLNTVSGFLRARRGTIRYKERRIDGLRADQIVALGIVQVSQSRDLFSTLSVYDNLSLGGLLQKDPLRIRESFRRVYQYFPILEKRTNQPSGSLSGGEQQMLAIGRALMSEPGFILLDEPTTGLAPMVVRDITGIISTMKKEGLTMIWVEQNAITAISIADYFYILRDGQIVFEGRPQALPEDKKRFFRQYYI